MEVEGLAGGAAHPEAIIRAALLMGGKQVSQAQMCNYWAVGSEGPHVSHPQGWNRVGPQDQGHLSQSHRTEQLEVVGDGKGGWLSCAVGDCSPEEKQSSLHRAGRAAWPADGLMQSCDSRHVSDRGLYVYAPPHALLTHNPAEAWLG